MQYKFRGQRITDNKWIYGSLLQWPDGECEIAELSDDKEGDKFMVKPETVGMWTGLKDKCGQELYEGDVYHPDGCTHSRYKVIFVSGAFVGGKSDEFCCPLGWADNEESLTKWICKIGNIHDHPHLLTPSQKGDVLNTMNNLDPKEQAASEATETVESTEQKAQEAALGAETVTDTTE